VTDAGQPVALHVAPHPDDEVIAAPATLMVLRDEGWRIVNLACGLGLGRPADRFRRRADLREGCERARLELIILEDAPGISSTDDLALAESYLSGELRATITRLGPDLIVCPSPHDGHHGHEVVARGIRDAVERRGSPARVMFWGVWRDLALPNVLQYAELLTDLRYDDRGAWRLMAPRQLNPGDPLGADDGPDGPDVTWWVHATSVRQRLCVHDQGSR
jgi:LmbE family N-acetylglucosaminyl deacetylase